MKLHQFLQRAANGTTLLALPFVISTAGLLVVANLSGGQWLSDWYWLLGATGVVAFVFWIVKSRWMAFAWTVLLLVFLASFGYGHITNYRARVEAYRLIAQYRRTPPIVDLSSNSYGPTLTVGSNEVRPLVIRDGELGVEYTQFGDSTYRLTLKGETKFPSYERRALFD